MGKIRIVGLGPSDEKDLTLAALEVIHNKNPNFVRTEQHESLTYFKKNQIPYTSFDFIYEEETSFENIYNRIVDTLLEKAKNEDINYYVPGNPFIAEKTVSILLERHLDTEVVSGLSFIEPMLSVVKKDPVNGLKIIDGDAFHYTSLDLHTDIIITQVYNSRILAELKIAITEVYGDEHMLYVISNAGIKSLEQVEHIPAYKLDRVRHIDHQTSIYLPKREENKEIKDWVDLVKVTETLRGENGCSWDMEQTNQSIARNMIEEAYEAVYALEYGTLDEFVEELGDLLFQIFLHSQIAYEEGEFNLLDVTSAITNKLIYRHPHVFQGTELTKGQWDNLKYKKLGITSFTDRLKNIVGLPALLRCEKVIDKVTKIGFQWETVDGVLDKVFEEYQETKEAIGFEDSKEHIAEEIGDLLFTCVNLCYYLGYDAEETMDHATDKFVKRFGLMEKLAHNRNLNFEDLDLSGLDELWDEAKEILGR